MNKLQFARKLRNNQTAAELKLWYFLRRKALFGIKFRRQHIIHPYIVDFVSMEKSLVIELDGNQHAEEKNIIYDKKRTEYLNKCGYKVIRFWDVDVMTNVEGVLEVIGDAICTSPSTPPGRRGM